MKKVYILFDGMTGSDREYPLTAFRTKRDLNSYVRKVYPGAGVGNRRTPKELYWETEYGWLKGRVVEFKEGVV